MVSSELVVLLIVCVGINTGSAQQQQPGKSAINTQSLYLPCAEPCQDDNNRNCTLDDSSDTNVTQCVTTTLNCVNNDCEAVINKFMRGCQFINIRANVSQHIHCCVCVPDDGPLTWSCTTIPPSLSLLPSGECSNSEPIYHDNTLSAVTIVTITEYN